MTFSAQGKCNTLSPGRLKTISGEVQNDLKEGAHFPTPPLKIRPSIYSHMLPLQDNLACLNLPKRAHACSNPLMYGSILPVTIPPGNPHGFADFLFPKCQFPTPGK
jgi:hypothetical protein